VHVCTAAHYDKGPGICTQDDRTIGNLAAAHVVVYAAGRTFSIDRLIVNLARRNSDGSSGPLGSATETGNRGYDWFYGRLYDDLFHAAGVAPQAGTTYQITARSGRQRLGWATFTYQPGTAPAFSTQTLVHICAAAHYEKGDQVCTQDDRTIGNLAAAHVVVYAAGRTFSTNSLMFNVVQRNSDGSSSPAGSYTDTGNRGYSWDTVLLYDVLWTDALLGRGVTPQAGSTYQIMVRSGRQSLGSATFKWHACVSDRDACV
jgi:hypothetical protein